MCAGFSRAKPNRTNLKPGLSLSLLLLPLFLIACATSSDHTPELTNTPIMPTLPPAQVNFTGTWDGAEYGIIIMSQEGRNVFGTYEYSDNVGGIHYGYLKGGVDGRTLKHRWWQSLTPGVSYEEAEERGDAYFILAKDGASIQGQWRSEGDSDWVGDWNLVRK